MPLEYETVHITINDRTIDACDVGTVIEPVTWRADIYHGPDAYEDSLLQFSIPQRLLFALRWYLTEVNNGGHSQFFTNSTGVVWKDACEAFRVLQIQAGRGILLEAADRLGGDPSLDRDERLRQLEECYSSFAEFDGALRDLDDALYDLQEKVNIDAAMQQFIRDHASEFHFSGEIRRAVLPKLRRDKRQ